MMISLARPPSSPEPTKPMFRCQMLSCDIATQYLALLPRFASQERSRFSSKAAISAARRHMREHTTFGTLLMSTGLTFGTIASLFGLIAGIIDKTQLAPDHGRRALRNPADCYRSALLLTRSRGRSRRRSHRDSEAAGSDPAEEYV